LDIWVRKGVEGHSFHLPLTPGCDISGLVVKGGPGAEKTFQPGTPVIVSPGVSCGRCEACLSGVDPLCRNYGILGETRDGGCADLITVPIANIIPRPALLNAAQGASLGVPFLTAWTMLLKKALLRPGETVLIHAGGSGVSVAAIQIAKLIGASVITTVGSDDKIEKAKQLGADHVIQYKKGPFREELKKILAGQGKKGCEVVIDHVGVDTLQDSLKSLAWGGRLVTCGATSGSNVSIDLKQVFFKNISILGSTMGSKADLLRIIQLVEQGKLRPVIDRTVPMSDLPKAMSALESRQVFGKVVVEN